MDLRFLCSYHEHLVLRNAYRAEELWQALTVQGKIELQQNQWARAASFFGSSAEIALLRSSVEQGHRQVDAFNRSLYASKFLIDSFCRIGDRQGAYTYLNQLSANAKALFGRQPSSKKFPLQDIRVKQHFSSFVSECHATIKQSAIQANELSMGLTKNQRSSQLNLEPKLPSLHPASFKKQDNLRPDDTQNPAPNKKLYPRVKTSFNALHWSVDAAGHVH